MPRLTLTSTVRQADHMLATELDGETVLMGIERGQYYGLERTAQDIWRLIQQPRTVGELCRELGMKYQVDPAECEGQVLAFLEKTLDEGLIVVV